MSPDDHFQDLKRIIAAVGGKARRLNVIMARISLQKRAAEVLMVTFLPPLYDMCVNLLAK